MDNIITTSQQNTGKKRIVQYWPSRFCDNMIRFREVTKYGALVSPFWCSRDEFAAMLWRLRRDHGIARREISQGNGGAITVLTYRTNKRFIMFIVGRDYQ